jgi:hypothetical protein
MATLVVNRHTKCRSDDCVSTALLVRLGLLSPPFSSRSVVRSSSFLWCGPQRLGCSGENARREQGRVSRDGGDVCRAATVA